MSVNNTSESLWNPDKCPGRPGFSLVELLVVMAIGAIVAGVAFSIYRLNARYSLQSESEVRRQQNLRSALYMLARDLRMAGNGFSVLGYGIKTIQAYVPFSPLRSCGTKPVVADQLDWFHYCDRSSPKGIRAIFGEDGGPVRSDLMTVFRAAPEFSATLGEVTQLNNNEIVLKEAVDPRAVLDGDILSMVNGSRAVLMEADHVSKAAGMVKSIYINKTGRYTGPDVVPSGFPVEGSYLFNLKDVSLVTYYVDEDKNQLVSVRHDQQAIPPGARESPATVVADNIEDLEFYYYFANESIDMSRINLAPSISSARLDQADIQAVTVGLTAKADIKYSRFGQSRPAMFNRQAGIALDTFSRNSLVATVQVRNFER
ncbi:MAG: prepilin-type N-terminal cleavage/methylation domain-containing protein [Deltaproteobacteria bacterium]|jgi:prepilin-type N-terminal cleavage/methylation domain-containing protein|nr:prepilin-type N-terminal cleavage/methylation domain-containing protein [Deltaproteobacteria bacterium]